MKVEVAKRIVLQHKDRANEIMEEIFHGCGIVRGIKITRRSNLFVMQYPGGMQTVHSSPFTVIASLI